LDGGALMIKVDEGADVSFVAIGDGIGRAIDVEDGMRSGDKGWDGVT